MSDPFDFIGAILLGTFLGSFATLVYHLRQIRQEARQNYLRLSLAHTEVVTLKRTLEFRRNFLTDFTPPIANPAVPESEAPTAPPLIPPWIAAARIPQPAGSAPKDPRVTPERPSLSPGHPPSPLGQGTSGGFGKLRNRLIPA